MNSLALKSLDALRLQRRDVLAALDAELALVSTTRHPRLLLEIDHLKNLLKDTLRKAEDLDERLIKMEQRLWREQDAHADTRIEMDNTQEELKRLGSESSTLGDDLEGAARGYAHTLDGSLQALGIPSYRAAELVRLLEGRACVAA